MFETEKNANEIASHYDGLFNLMEQDHGLTLTISEMDDIIREAQKVVGKFKPDVRDSRTSQPEPCDHSWMNSGLSVQGKSVMVCTKCRREANYS
jgi:hypothetical protein